MTGKFTNSFEPRLEKIGHTRRGGAAETQTGELRSLIDQMGLIAVAEFCSHSCGGARSKRLLLQDPMAFFLLESQRIPWVRRVAPLGPDYPRLAHEFGFSGNQIRLYRGILLQ